MGLARELAVDVKEVGVSRLIDGKVVVDERLMVGEKNWLGRGAKEGRLFIWNG